MMDWSQNTINQYYTACLKQHVKPKLDFETRTLELIGPKDAVIARSINSSFILKLIQVQEAENYFYELTTEVFKEARIHAVSRGVVWSVEVTSGSNTWEQYSYKLNGIIEDAYLKKLPHVCIEKSVDQIGLFFLISDRLCR